MAYKFHLAVNGEPVGMDIGDAHEDRDHQALVVEILVLVDLLNDDNLTVGGSHDELVGVLGGEIAYRTAVEIDYNSVN